MTQTFSELQPREALGQIKEFVLGICDKILSVPKSSRQLCLTPILQWLTLHQVDGVTEVVMTK